MKRWSRWQFAAVVVSTAIGVAAWSSTRVKVAAQSASSPYHRVENWPQKLPPGKTFGSVAGVAIDKQNIIYVLQRDTSEVSKFDQSGKYLGTWGTHPSGDRGAHHLLIDRQGNFWMVFRDTHVVTKYSPDGKLLMTLGKEGVFGSTPDTFNGPTRVRQLANGNIVVADGYWNSRLVFFDQSGKFLKAFGSYGYGPGRFGTVHEVVEDNTGRLIVVDMCMGTTQMPRPQFLKPGQVDERRKTPVTPDCKVEGQGRLHVIDQNGNDGGYFSDITRPLSLAVIGNRVFASSLTRPDIWSSRDTKPELRLTAGEIKVLDAATGKPVEPSIPSTGNAHSMYMDPQGDIIITTLGVGGAPPFARYTRKK